MCIGPELMCTTFRIINCAFTVSVKFMKCSIDPIRYHINIRKFYSRQYHAY